jgi:hypothetical protein
MSGCSKQPNSSANMSCSENKYTFINTKQKNKTRFLNIDNIK